MTSMDEIDILSDRFMRRAVEAIRRARQDDLESGQAIGSVDERGRYIEERPDGRRFEVRLDLSKPRESHRITLREIGAGAA